MNTFQKFIAISRYSRWMPELGRRETWEETVDRWWNYFTSKAPTLSTRPDIKEAIYNLEVLPSMRGLMTAGPALDRDHTALYNCSYLEITSPKSFSELMYILMCGTGVGYSVERRCVEKLPTVPKSITKDFVGNIIYVEDSREGWCHALLTLINSLYEGIHPRWDTSLVRPAGSRLKTFGGRASGPAPLEEVMRFIVGTFYKAQGRKLSALECHDICCKIAQSVIVGGVRRSAMISLSDLSDREMATCKSGAWWETSGHRALANNSAIYTSKPPLGQFLEEWTSLYNSHSGERGICNREAMSTIAKKSGRTDADFGTNPCSEIILKPNEFCNLSTIVVKATDTLQDLERKIEQATIIGTIQSMFTYFPHLSDEFRKNSEEERLLGVSMTGIFDNKLTCGQLGYAKLAHALEKLRDIATITNLKWADKLGITPSKSITCIKPEGTTSCLADASSGLHPRYADYYFRRVRIDKKDPLYNMMCDSGVPVEDCVMNSDSTAVFTFAQKAPEGSLTQKNLTALEHLKLWKAYQDHYCNHKPSITVNYTDDEFMGVGQWVWDNFDSISGISFLPKSDHVYAQAPFEEIDARTYNMHPKPVVDFNNLTAYEKEDTTKSSHTMACTANGCELV